MQGADYNIVWKPLPGSQTLAMCCPAHVIFYHGTRGPGKGLPLNEPVYTERGPRPIGSLSVGDWVACPDGTQSQVIGVFPQGKRPTYEIEFADGAIARCDDQHIWPVHIQDGNKPGSVGKYGYKLMTTPELISKFRSGSAKLHIPTLDSLRMRYKTHQFNNRLKVDPYILGLMLGDGSFTQQGSYCTIDQDLAEAVLGAGFKEWATDQRSGVRNFGISPSLREGLKSLGLWGKLSDEKFVPESYLHHTDENRLAVLQGLMDTDGTIDSKGYITFASSSEQLSKDVQYLARSLGANATLTVSQSSLNGVRYKDVYSVYIQPGNKFNPFRLRRKADRVLGYMHEKLWKRIIDIREIGEQETVCIKIDHPLGLFITRDFVVTHNTDAQLMRFRRNVGQGYGRHWRGVIFDREYKNLDDLVSKSMRWFPEFNDGAKFMSSKADYRWRWPTGEELLFRAIRRDSDYWAYHGQEFPFIGWNELTKYPNSNLFDMMMSCNRSSFLPEENGIYDEETGTWYYPPEMPLEVFATGNPFGAGHNWVKKRFINAAPMGKVVRRVVNVFNPRTKQRQDIEKTQVHLFGSYRENKYLSPEYVAELETMQDPNKRRAWLMGDWDVASGGMFDEDWDSLIHVVPPFKIPSSWRIDKSFDYGSSKPFSVGWWAESDGTEITMPDGKVVQTVKGDLFRIGEWYGTNGKPNTGLRLLAKDIAKGIIERELAMGIYNRVQLGPADNSIWDEDDGKSIAKSMEEKVKINGKTYRGVRWARSNKSAGSRKLGWEECRKMLAGAKAERLTLEDGSTMLGPRENPGLFVWNTCRFCIELFPSLPRDEKDPDDVDTDSEDHIGDEVRYRVLALRQAMDTNMGYTT